MLNKGTSALSNFDLSLFEKSDLLKRIWFTICILVVYRLGTYIPIPGINPMIIDSIISKNAVGILGIFNLFSGGALGRMTIFALNVMPYIVSSIIIQLLSVTIKPLQDLKHEGELGRRKINSYIRYMTIIFCVIQGFVILFGLEGMNSNLDTIVINPGILFKVTGVCSLLGGTMLLMWLGERINVNGIGNGISLIIFTGIVSELPGAFSSMLSLVRNGGVTMFMFFMVMLSFVLLLFLIIFIERSYRCILVQYPKRQVKNKIYNSNFSHIPLKINMSGVIPPIFANAVLLTPVTIANFNRNSAWSDFILTYFSTGKLAYIVLYILFIVFFAFFYTSFVFNAEETADMLKKNGGFVPGKRPGKSTYQYFEYVILRLTVIGALYLAVICILPEVIRYNYSIPFTFGGTSLLIIVNVIVDTFSQIQTYLFTNKYDSLIKKSKLWKVK